MGRMDWGKALDLRRAETNLRTEFIGDWHTDPWGWPELSFLVKDAPDSVITHLNGTGAYRLALLDVPKENWGSRPAVILDIADRLIYQSLVDRLSVDLIGDMADSAFGWRLPPADAKRGQYSQNSIQWSSYRHRLTQAASLRSVALTTDIVSFFASIPLRLVEDTLADRAGSSRVVDRLVALLAAFDRVPERTGLPQRSLASAVIANAVVRPLDDLLIGHAKPLPFTLYRPRDPAQASPTMSAARWMDDMWLFTRDAALARRAQTELQSAARSLGLDLNSAKTNVYEGEEVVEQAMQVEHSAVDQALLDTGDTTPLEELLDRLLDDPEHAGRTSLKFAVKRMRDNGLRYRIDDLLSLAPRMPHAADAVAPLLKDAFDPPVLEEWFLEYAKGDWAAFPWAVAQYAHMFPTTASPRTATREFFTDIVIVPDTPLPLLAVATQRLAAWDAATARVAIRSSIVRAANPHARRVLALGSLLARESRASVRRWLEQEEENRVTLDMLEKRGYPGPKVTAYFAG